MSSQTQRSVSDFIQDQTIIDVDVHLGKALTYDIVSEHLDEPHYGRLMNSTGPSPLPYSGWDRSSGGKLSRDRRSYETPEDFLELYGDFGIDFPIMNTMSYLTRVPETDFAVALARAYNDAMLDYILDEHAETRGLVTIATQDPGAAAEEIDRIGDEDQIVGIYIATGGPDLPLGDPAYDVMYDAAEAHGLAVVYHGHADAFISDFSRQNQALEEYVSVNALAHPWNQMLTMTSLIEQGTPVKFPDLEFVFVEAGLLWAAYMMFRLNKEHSMQPDAAPLLEKPPEAYIREQFYFGTQPIEEPSDPRQIELILELLGAESIMFASDFPHWDFDNPQTIIETLRASLDSEDVRKVLTTNAASVFGYEV